MTMDINSIYQKWSVVNERSIRKIFDQRGEVRMIYITGDCHADFTRFNTKIFPEQYEMTKDDYVIICGDFGGVWNRFEENKHEKHWMDWLEDRPFTTLFVRGTMRILTGFTAIL